VTRWQHFLCRPLRVPPSNTRCANLSLPVSPGIPGPRSWRLESQLTSGYVWYIPTVFVSIYLYIYIIYIYTYLQYIHIYLQYMYILYTVYIHTCGVHVHIYIYYIIQHYIQTNYKKCQRTMDGVITRLASSFGCASRRMMYVMVSFISEGVRYFVYTAILLYI